jgi:hypothetical protein
VLLADGTVKEVTFEGQGRKKLGEIINVGGQDAIVVGIKNNPTKSVEELKALLPDLQRVADANGVSKKQILDLYEALGPKGVKSLATRTDNEILAALEAVRLEKLEGGHSLFRHGSQVSHPDLKHRLKTGYAPDAWAKPKRWSPTPGSTRFSSYSDWMKTRDVAFDGILANHGVDLRLNLPPSPGAPTRYAIVVEHKGVIGGGHVGRPGTRVQIPDPSGQLVNRGYSATDPVGGIKRTTTTIVWDSNLNRWKVVQHFPEARTTAPADYVVP